MTQTNGYERVTYRDESGTKPRNKTVLLTDVDEGKGLLLRGVQVDKDGVRQDPSRTYLKAHGAECGTIVHLIEMALIIKRERLIQDYIYGGLVSDGTVIQQPAVAD